MRPLQECRRLPKRGHRAAQQLKPLAAALREAGNAQGDPKCAWCSEHLYVGQFCLRDLACALALTKSQQGLSCARAGVQIAHVSNLSAPDFGAEHCGTLLEV